MVLLDGWLSCTGNSLNLVCITSNTILNINQPFKRVIINANTTYTKLFLHPLNDQLDLDVIPVKAFPHFSAICVVIAVFVIFNCFLLIMLFALKLLPLRTQTQTNAICWRNFIFPYWKHFCTRMHHISKVLLTKHIFTQNNDV